MQLSPADRDACGCDNDAAGLFVGRATSGGFDAHFGGPGGHPLCVGVGRSRQVGGSVFSKITLSTRIFLSVGRMWIVLVPVDLVLEIL